jgi:hypothetical protein
MVISKAPSRLSPNARNSTAMKPFTQGFEPSCLTPTGPSSAVTSNPKPEKRTMIPRQKTTACATPPRFPPDCWWRKNDIVMGIMGKTQGVKIQASPAPKATSRNAPQPCASGDGTAADAADGGWASANPAGMARDGAGAAGSTVSATVRVHLPGTQRESLQVW